MTSRRKPPPGAEPPRPKSATPPAAPPGDAVRKVRAGPWVLAAMMATYVAFFFNACLVKYRFFLYTDMDLAIFSQAVHQLLTGSTWNSIRGMNWLADHSSLVLFAVAPLTAPFDPAIALLALQALGLALGALPVHRLARDLIDDEKVAWACAALYLLYPAVGYINLFEFHPESLAVAPLLAALSELVRRRAGRALLWAGVAMLAKEDVALAVMGLAGIAWFRGGPRRTRTSLGLTAAATLSLLVTFLWLKPAFGQGEVEYGRMYAAWGSTPSEIVLNLVREPWKAVAALWQTPGHAEDTLLKQQYWIHMLLPLSFLPLAAPEILLAALPNIALNLLSDRWQQHTIAFQYTASAIPPMIAATIFGMARIVRVTRARRGARALALVALGCALASNVLFGPLFGRGIAQERGASERVWPDRRDRAARPHRERLLRDVPARSSVAASFEFLPRLSGRPEIHSMHHIIGRYTYSTKPYPVPHRLDAVLASFGNEFNVTAHERILGLLQRSRLHPQGSFDDVVLFLPSAADTVSLLEPSTRRPELAAGVVFEHQLRFLGCDLAGGLVRPDRVVELNTYWSAEAPVDRVFVTRLWLFDEAERMLLYRTRYLGYGLAPVSTWPLGRSMRESYRLVLPDSLAPGRYRVVMQLARIAEGVPASAIPDDPALAGPEAYVVVANPIVP